MSSSGESGTDGDATNADAPSSGDEDGNGEEWWQRTDPEPPSIGPGAPEVDVPEVDVPEVEVPGSDDPVGTDVDADVASAFWRLVLIFDVALLALALGPMFLYFEGDLRRGGMLLAFGALVFVYGVARYREFRDVGDVPGDDASSSGASSTESDDGG